MDNIEYSVLSEVCSVNYSELLTSVYESYYRKRSQDNVSTLLGMIAEKEKNKEKQEQQPKDPYGVTFNHRVLAVLTDFDFKYHFKVSKTTVEVGYIIIFILSYIPCI